MQVFNNKFLLSFNTVVFYLLTRIQLTIFFLLLSLLKNKHVLRYFSKNKKAKFLLLFY